MTTSLVDQHILLPRGLQSGSHHPSSWGSVYKPWKQNEGVGRTGRLLFYHRRGMDMAQGNDGSSHLSPHYAFVVQLQTDIDVEAGHVAGRVEHVVSRQASGFQSLETLLAFIARVLREIRQGPPQEGA